MTDTRLRLRLLHLSDLHARADREGEPWRRRRVLGPAWEANLDALLEDGRLDLVCFTGDAADWGQTEEFKEAGDFLLALMDRLHLDRDRLFVVPGNHDIDRRIHPDAWSGLREAARDVDDFDLARLEVSNRHGWSRSLSGRLLIKPGYVTGWLGHGELDPTVDWIIGCASSGVACRSM